MPYSKLKAEIRKHWRTRYVEEMQKRGEPLPPGFQVEEAGDGELHPPEPARVARRGTCLAAVALRGLAAQWPEEQQKEFLPELTRWLDQAELDDEIEQTEFDAIKTPAGALAEQDAINAVWRWEGVAVLGAALGLKPLPPHDQTIEPKAYGDAFGLFQSAETVRKFATLAKFDPAFDRFAFANQALAIHWRLRQYFQVERKPIDFAEFARGVTWADFNLEGVKLTDGDLSVGGVSITEADEQLVGATLSIATERHVAANWLIGWEPVYSDVETPT